VVLRLIDRPFVLAEVTAVVAALIVYQVRLVLIVYKFLAVIDGVKLWLIRHPYFASKRVLVFVKFDLFVARVDFIRQFIFAIFRFFAFLGD